jgi:hypothetical protein
MVSIYSMHTHINYNKLKTKLIETKIVIDQQKEVNDEKKEIEGAKI